MIATDQAAAVLNRVRPFVQDDGGDIQLVGVNGSSVFVSLTGRCAGCPSAHMTLYLGVEDALRRAVPELGDVRLSEDRMSCDSSVRRLAAAAGPAMSPTVASTPDALVKGRSARMRALFDFLRVIDGSDSTVLITGESGTGKEVTATMIHRASRRRSRPFVAVSCALFSETLIESELFGHERGAFTNAIKDRPGRFELADGGTLFLDDIDDIPLSMQVKLLRVLQNRTIERLGATRTVPVNVRVIAATKHDLKQMVADGRFREDLFYRLNVLPITLPALRDRREDIPDLVRHFFERASRRRGVVAPIVPERVQQAFMQYEWPGNVREVENACERIVQTCFCGTVGAGCLSFDMLSQSDAAPFKISSDTILPRKPTPIALDDRLRELESTLIDWALRVSGGNKSKAAELLKIRRSTFSDRLGRVRQAQAGPDIHGQALDAVESEAGAMPT